MRTSSAKRQNNYMSASLASKEQRKEYDLIPVIKPLAPEPKTNPTKPRPNSLYVMNAENVHVSQDVLMMFEERYRQPNRKLETFYVSSGVNKVRLKKSVADFTNDSKILLGDSQITNKKTTVSKTGTVLFKVKKETKKSKVKTGPIDMERLAELKKEFDRVKTVDFQEDNIQDKSYLPQQTLQYLCSRPENKLETNTNEGGDRDLNSPEKKSNPKTKILQLKTKAITSFLNLASKSPIIKDALADESDKNYKTVLPNSPNQLSPDNLQRKQKQRHSINSSVITRLSNISNKMDSSANGMSLFVDSKHLQGIGRMKRLSQFVNSKQIEEQLKDPSTNNLRQEINRITSSEMDNAYEQKLISKRDQISPEEFEDYDAYPRSNDISEESDEQRKGHGNSNEPNVKYVKQKGFPHSKSDHRNNDDISDETMNNPRMSKSENATLNESEHQMFIRDQCEPEIEKSVIQVEEMGFRMLVTLSHFGLTIPLWSKFLFWNKINSNEAPADQNTEVTVYCFDSCHLKLSETRHIGNSPNPLAKVKEETPDSKDKKDITQQQVDTIKSPKSYDRSVIPSQADFLVKNNFELQIPKSGINLFCNDKNKSPIPYHKKRSIFVQPVNVQVQQGEDERKFKIEYVQRECKGNYRLENDLRLLWLETCIKLIKGLRIQKSLWRITTESIPLADSYAHRVIDYRRKQLDRMRYDYKFDFLQGKTFVHTNQYSLKAAPNKQIQVSDLGRDYSSLKKVKMISCVSNYLSVFVVRYDNEFDLLDVTEYNQNERGAFESFWQNKSMQDSFNKDLRDSTAVKKPISLVNYFLVTVEIGSEYWKSKKELKCDFKVLNLSPLNFMDLCHEGTIEIVDIQSLIRQKCSSFNPAHHRKSFRPLDAFSSSETVEVNDQQQSLNPRISIAFISKSLQNIHSRRVPRSALMKFPSNENQETFDDGNRKSIPIPKLKSTYRTIKPSKVGNQNKPESRPQESSVESLTKTATLGDVAITSDLAKEQKSSQKLKNSNSSIDNEELKKTSNVFVSLSNSMLYLQPKAQQETNVYIPLSRNGNSMLKNSSLENMRNDPITYQNFDNRLKMNSHARVDSVSMFRAPQKVLKKSKSFKKTMPDDEAQLEIMIKDACVQKNIDPTMILIGKTMRDITNHRKTIFREVDFFIENNRPTEKFLEQIREKISKSIYSNITKLIEKDYLKAINKDGRQYMVSHIKASDRLIEESSRFRDLPALMHTQLFTKLLSREYPVKSQYILEIFPQMREKQ